MPVLGQHLALVCRPPTVPESWLQSQLWLIPMGGAELSTTRLQALSAAWNSWRRGAGSQKPLPSTAPDATKEPQAPLRKPSLPGLSSSSNMPVTLGYWDLRGVSEGAARREGRGLERGVGAESEKQLGKTPPRQAPRNSQYRHPRIGEGQQAPESY